MDDFIWTTELPLNNNIDVMDVFLEEHMKQHCGDDFEIILEDGTYAEIQNDNGDLWAVHAGGNGDFCNHKVTFDRLLP